MMDPKHIDWSKLGFGYIKTNFRFVSTWKDGQWSEGKLIEDAQVHLHEGSPALHYAQQCFEGLKAQRAPDGRILLFRADLNAERMLLTARRLLIPELPTDLFLRGVRATVRANAEWVPPHGLGASMYIRPFLIGTGENLGLRPAKEFEFRVFVSPVGPYYGTAGFSPVAFAEVGIDRAAPRGTGNVKAGGNYAGGLLATRKAQELGAKEALYLDASTRRFLEEAGSANIILAMKGNRLVTPQSEAILSSITRRSLMELGKRELGLQCEERPVEIRKELSEILEMGACGTAAVLSPIHRLYLDDQWHEIGPYGEQAGPVMTKLYELLTSLQIGTREDPYRWTEEVSDK
jgi:branched-chain amino acid aminotransferase